MNEFNGIDLLRTAVNVLNNCNETFNTKYSAQKLLTLVEMYLNCGWDITPDNWTNRQIKEALEGKCPEWDNNEKPFYKVLPDYISGDGSWYGLLKTPHREITEDDVDRKYFELDGLTVRTEEFFGRITSLDVGKRVYRFGDIFQVENDEQFKKRVEG